jgi:EpsD family peptidyl-prolyl cis-trans isomerase
MMKTSRIHAASLGAGALALLAIASLGLSGCNDKGEKKAATQVVAKVNGDEISVHQINFVLGRAEGITTENAPRAKREILDKLIDQQLAVHQAEEEKLDRTPEVMQALDAARRDILARAYLKRLADSQAKPTAEEAKTFYTEHPELFAQRRVFNVQQLLVAGDATLAGEIQQWASQNKPMQDIAATLNNRRIRFNADAGVRAAEQLPMEVLPKLAALKDGQTAVLPGPQGILVIRVLASEAKPVDEATAVPRIQVFLANKRSNEFVAAQMRGLRDKAKIEKLGEFADNAAPAAAAPAAAAPAAATPATPAAMDDKAIAKGVAGLK